VSIWFTPWATAARSTASQRRVTIFGRAKHAGAGELHGAIAQPLHHAVAERERARLIDSVEKLFSCDAGCSLIQSLKVSRTEDHDGTSASRTGCVVL
jgi:hypothetical protein